MVSRRSHLAPGWWTPKGVSTGCLLRLQQRTTILSQEWTDNACTRIVCPVGNCLKLAGQGWSICAINHMQTAYNMRRFGSTHIEGTVSKSGGLTADRSPYAPCVNAVAGQDLKEQIVGWAGQGDVDGWRSQVHADDLPADSSIQRKPH